MAHSPGPFYVALEYTNSLFGPHRQIIPTLDWTDVASANNHGQFDTWNPGGVDAQDMIEALVTLLLPFYNSDVAFNQWTIFHKPDPVGPSFPLQGDSFTAMVGTNVSATWAKAVQVTLNFRSDAFGAFKITALDAPADPDFDKVTIPLTRHTNLLAELADQDKGWKARDETRVETFLSQTVTLNEKLRRSYRMT